jgi:hypothetical protein
MMAIDTTFAAEMRALAHDLLNEDFASVTELVTYTSLAVDTTDFDAVTGLYATTTTTKELLAIRNVDRVKARDDRPLTAKETWLIVAAVDLDSIIPQPGTDYLLRAGKRWELVDMDTDPAVAVYNLHVRLP